MPCLVKSFTVHRIFKPGFPHASHILNALFLWVLHFLSTAHPGCWISPCLISPLSFSIRSNCASDFYCFMNAAIHWVQTPSSEVLSILRNSLWVLKRAAILDNYFLQSINYLWQYSFTKLHLKLRTPAWVQNMSIASEFQNLSSLRLYGMLANLSTNRSEYIVHSI